MQLRDVLRNAVEDDNVRVIMVLKQDDGVSEHELSHPSEFSSRQAWREEIIKNQTQRIENEIGSIIEQLRNLSLRVAGGTIHHLVSVEGTAQNLVKSLDLPGVKYVTFDEQLGSP